MTDDKEAKREQATAFIEALNISVHELIKTNHLIVESLMEFIFELNTKHDCLDDYMIEKWNTVRHTPDASAWLRIFYRVYGDCTKRFQLTDAEKILFMAEVLGGR